MIATSLTNGKVSGTGNLLLTEGGLFGGALISTDGTNAAVVTVTDIVTEKKVFDVSTKTPLFVSVPILTSSTTLAYSVTGTGASAQFYELKL